MHACIHVYVYACAHTGAVHNAVCAAVHVAAHLRPPRRRRYLSCVLESLSRHTDDAGVVKEACRAVMNLAVNDANKIAIAPASGIERLLAALIEELLAALRAHAGHAGVAEQACGAGRNLADHDVNKVAIAEAGGI